MLKLRQTGAAFAVLLGLSVASPVLAQSQTLPPEENPVVARVDGTEIRLDRVMSMIQDLPEQYRQAPIDRLYPLLVRRAVNNVLMLDKAMETDIPNSEELAADVKAYRDSKIMEFYLIDTIEQRTGEDVLRARYDEFVKNSEPDPSVNARHILVKTEDEAKALITELKGGADFAELAKAKSQGPSAPQGGDLGFFKKGQMVPAFEEAAFGMEPGAFSKTPVQSQFGWHVIKVEARQDYPSYEDKRDDLRREMSGEILSALVDELRGGAKIEEFMLDGKTPLPEPAQ